MNFINIKEYVKERKNTIGRILSELKEKFGIIPEIAIVQVGNNEASNRYVRNKIKDFEEVGIKAHWYGYEEGISERGLIEEIIDLQDNYDGIIVQQPLPS